MIRTLEHKTFKEKQRAESIEHGQEKAQCEFDCSLYLSNRDNIKRRASTNNIKKFSMKEEAAISTSCSKKNSDYVQGGKKKSQFGVHIWNKSPEQLQNLHQTHFKLIWV